LSLVKPPHRTRLADLQAICAANYARFLQVFPGYEQYNRREFAVGEARVVMEVQERSRYTTIFQVWQHSDGAEWLGTLRAELRAYHDARLLEVGTFQHCRRVRARYAYPNPEMHQPDEKFQQNRFIGDWLAHCLQRGRAQVLPRLVRDQ